VIYVAFNAIMPETGKIHLHSPRLILGILALSLLLKLAIWSHVVFFGDPTVDFGMMDTRGYHEPALSLVQSGRLDTFLDPPGMPMTYRTPGYPVFLAAIYAVFGANWAVVTLIQAILATITVYLTWRLARKFWGDRVALVAAALVAVDPVSSVLSQKIMTENNFALFIMIAVLTGVNLLTENRRRVGWALLLGLALALATLTRPSSYYLPVPVILGVLIWGLKRRWRMRTLALSVGMILLPLFLLIGGWIWRNYRVTGVPIYTSIEGYYAYFWQGAEVLANIQGRDISEVQTQLGLGDGLPSSRGDGYRQMHPETKDWNFERLCVRWQQDGMNIIKAHPGVFAKVYFAGVLRALTRPGVNNLLDMIGLELSELSPHALWQHPLAGFAFAYTYFWLLVVYLGVILYLVKGLRSDSLDIGRLFVLGVTLYLILLSGGPSAMARFRVPLIPLFSLFCAYQLGQVWNRFSPVLGEKS
jgi:4-amino-4-deoxy-L-arabinose transferase-like glycosyltransferase